MSKNLASPARPAPSARPRPLARLRAQHPILTTLLPVGLVVAVIVVMVVIKTAGGGSPTLGSQASTHGNRSSSATASALPAGVLADVTTVSPSTLAAVGLPTGLAAPIPTPAGQKVLTAGDGKPEVLYVGAEFCPFCAAERWGLVVALSRFGTFSRLKATHSSTIDEFPDTKTFSFYHSTYTSPYLDFESVEEETNQLDGGNYGVLQIPTAAQTAVVDQFDVSPYTSDPGTIPFVSIGDRYIVSGASYTPQILAGLSLQTIARDINDPHSEVAAAIDGTANEMTAAICAITGDQPASVCDSPTIAAIAKKLGK